MGRIRKSGMGGKNYLVNPPTLQFLLEALSCQLSRVNEYKQFEIDTLVLVSSKETHCWFYMRLILCAQ